MEGSGAATNSSSTGASTATIGTMVAAVGAFDRPPPAPDARGVDPA
jgi:hypothetical protein